MKHRELTHESVQNNKIDMVKKILLVTASLLIIYTILTRGLYLYVQYRSNNTQITIYELNEENIDRALR